MACRRSTLLLAALAAAPAARAGEVESREPSEKNRGAVYSWKWADNLPYEYYVPKEYDPKVGANLVLVLHGNGLDQRWTFANHDAGKFRRDDIVVSPEGTTYSESMKTHEFFEGKENADKLHELIVALKKTFKIRQTFLYGHSQGAFFVLKHAGLYPDDVDGVLAHSGGLWYSSPVGSFGHKQAIALMHGTDDPNVPYGNSTGALGKLREAGYPLAHLRTLWEWQHWPTQFQAELELSWCEGMTSSDPARVEKCLAALSAKAVKGGLDPAALDAVAARLEKMSGASPAAVAAAKAARGRVAKAAADVVAALEKCLGKGKLTKMDGKEWHGLLVRFLADFDGVPALETFTKAHAADLAAVAKTAERAGTEFWSNESKDRSKAALAGAEVLESGWTNGSAPKIAAELAEWLKDAKSLKLAKKDASRFETLVEQYQKSRKDGADAYAKLIKDLAD
jgi:predicted esterase